jgi:malate dehydrogenase
MHTWAHGTAEGDWVSMGIPSDGSYGAPEGIITSYPVTCSDGAYSIVQGLDINEFSQSKIEASWAELVEERDVVSGLGLLG